ncbi:Uncharacterised protein [Mycobacteroides abscessus subsp. abscessus]|nr:Uncharacterised protein [Mycobacteroides abscessus subsp. abscessus]
MRRRRCEGTDRSDQRHDGANSFAYGHVDASFPLVDMTLVDMNGGEPVPEVESLRRHRLRIGVISS